MFFTMKRFFAFLPALLFACTAKAQATSEKPALASPLLAQYDLHYVKLDISMNNTSTSVAGKATLKATVTEGPLAQFAFELDSALVIDSVHISGAAVTLVRSGNVATTTLPAPLSTGQQIHADIWYQGSTPAGATFFTHGLLVDPNYFDHSITYSVSDRFLAKDWWPSKQDIRDKIDSADLWITVPDSVQVASNGVLSNITPVAPGHQRFEWQTRYPTTYYLLSVAIMPYQLYETQAYVETDSLPVMHFLPDAPGLLATLQPQLDTVSLVLSYFSELFGRYPFWEEKYGQAFAPLGGGMEHQTISTIGQFSTTLMAHELCHQWWGDAVTFHTWADIWLSEGFASYGEQLFMEHFQTPELARNARQYLISSITSLPGGSIFVDDTTSEARVFDGRLTYNKGSMVVHMLRQHIQNDSLFFAGLRQYLTAHTYGNAATEDLQSVLEGTAGMNLDTFFQQWVYGEGYPRYDIRWNQSGSEVYVQLTQSSSKPMSVPFFHTPVFLKLKSADGDTTVRLYHSETTQLFTIPWDKTLTGVQLDPDKHMVCRQLTNVKQPNLSILQSGRSNLQLTGNPAHSGWQLRSLTAPATLSLMDLSGHILGQWQTTGSATSIPAGNLHSGPYLLAVRQQGAAPVYFRLIKY